jgi:hypothetical protein
MKCLPEEFLAFLPRGLVTAAIISHERERERRDTLKSNNKQSIRIQNIKQKMA